MKKIKSQIINPLTFISFLFFLVSLVYSSQAATYYHKYKDGIPIYTNIPPVERGYKRIVIQNQTYDVRKNAFGKFTYSKNYDDHINKTAKWYGIDPYLVKAVIKVESNFNGKSVSPKGAIGVMQLMPETARDQGVDNPFDPSENIKGGVRYLKKLIEMFNGDLRLALAGYNAGENAVIKYGYTIPPYNETVNYVDKVLVHYNYLKNKLFEEPDKEVVKTNKEPEMKKEALAKETSVPFNKMDKTVKVTTNDEESLSTDKILIVETKKTEVLIKTDSTVIPSVDSNRRFTVQIASFPDLGDAQEMEQSLKLKSYPAFIQKAEVPGKGIWYRVRVGKFTTRQEAKQYGDTMKSNEPGIGAVLITLNK
ncbi:MAG: lytic transglycosylase domain-containing protein [Deltaproteobacteria bacterium]|nr:lytic transglycosylase domain-containing protein [Deltaproteobacteria bacterium]